MKLARPLKVWEQDFKPALVEKSAQLNSKFSREIPKRQLSFLEISFQTVISMPTNLNSSRKKLAMNTKTIFTDTSRPQLKMLTSTFIENIC